MPFVFYGDSPRQLFLFTFKYAAYADSEELDTPIKIIPGLEFSIIITAMKKQHEVKAVVDTIIFSVFKGHELAIGDSTPSDESPCIANSVIRFVSLVLLSRYDKRGESSIISLTDDVA